MSYRHISCIGPIAEPQLSSRWEAGVGLGHLQEYDEVGDHEAEHLQSEEFAL